MSDWKVPFVDLQQRYLEEREELLTCVERVLSKGHLVLTPEVAALEEKETLDRSEIEACLTDQAVRARGAAVAG